MSPRQFVGIIFLLLLHASAVFAQPGPLLVQQNSNLVISVSALLSNGVPGFTNSAATLTLGSVSQSVAGGKVLLVGNRAWVERFDGPQKSHDDPLDMVVDHEGSVLVTGNSDDYDSESDFLTIKYSADGKALWTNRFDGPAHRTDYARFVAVDDLNNVYVNGEAFHGDRKGPSDIITIKYSPEGTPVWTNAYNPTGTNRLQASSLAVDAAGNVYIQWSDFSTVKDPRTLLKYDSTGVAVWTNHSDHWLLALDAEGHLFTAGESSSRKLAPDGTVLWTNQFFHSFLAQPTAIAVDPQGNLLVTGDGFSPRRNVTIKYAANGVPLWTNFMGAPDYQGGNVPTIACDPLGNVFVTGGSGFLADRNVSEFITVKYSAVGTPLWTNRFEYSVGNPFLGGMVVDNAGNLYLAGNSFEAGTGINFFTFKCGANGMAIWTNYYSGPANSYDAAMDVVVSDSGQVHVLGFSDADYATVTYADQISYTPPRGFNGFDHFTFTVFDRFGNSTTGQVTIQVVPLASGFVDQRNDAETLLMAWSGSPFVEAFGQEFVPLADSIGFVDLIVQNGSTPVSVSIREDTINGTIVGTSFPSIPSASWDLPTRFHFPTGGISVTPGRTYVLRVVGGASVLSSTDDLYPLGQMIQIPASEVQQDYDLWFRLGPVPPASNSVIYFQNTNRQVARWQLNNITVTTNELLAGRLPLPLGGSRGGIADFDHNRENEIFWHKNDGGAFLRSITSTGFLDHALPQATPLRNPTNWNVAAVGDLNGDAEVDVLWRSAKGRFDFWQMAQGDFVSSTILTNTLDPGLWRVVGIADLNRDTHNDIVSQRSDGQMRVWFMEGTNRVNVANLMRDGLNPLKVNTVAGWSAVGLADFNADNDPDILLSNVDGRQAVWVMSQSRRTFTYLLRDGRKVNPGWRIIGVR